MLAMVRTEVLVAGLIRGVLATVSHRVQLAAPETAKGAVIRFTLDDADPTADSSAYAAPIAAGWRPAAHAFSWQETIRHVGQIVVAPHVEVGSSFDLDEFTLDTASE